MTIYAKADIDEAIVDYAIFHEVETDQVEVTTRQDENGEVVGFRLSLDKDGHSKGCDQSFGEW